MMKRTAHLKSCKQIVDLDSYSGKWVAFIDNHPAVCAESLNLLMRKVKEQNLPKEPSIMLVPRKDEGPYILHIL